MEKRRYTYFRLFAYRELMIESLAKRAAGTSFGASDDFPKDPAIAKVDEVMRRLVGTNKLARDSDICRRHQDARLRGLLEWCKENIDYLAENGYRLFAVERDIDRFVSLVYDCAGILRAQTEAPDPNLPSWLMPALANDVQPPIDARIRFGPEEKAILATAYARLLGVRTVDLFDEQWRVRFSEGYLASCLRERGVLTIAWPDFGRMERLLRDNA